MTSKPCRKCGDLKPEEHFRREKTRSGAYYFTNECKACQRVRLDARNAKIRKDPVQVARIRRADSLRRMTKPDRLNHIFNATAAGARKRGISFHLAKADVFGMIEKQDWRCSKTGIKFDLTYGAGKRPFSPSVDRIDNSKPYTPDNVQVVCSIYNFAKNVFTDADVTAMAKGLLQDDV